ncbi:MAG: MgtC/SapB family protein [Burkholderiaceae bacterium]|jgi:putative Mg2+ transporter-C (MgtC) family protein
MEAFFNFEPTLAFHTLVQLAVAFTLGSAIGLERQYRQRTAGLRTNALVAVGAAVFVDLGNRLLGHEGAAHVVAYVVSGVGFLGAGAIMREEGNVRGLNTAATLWGSAAVGACAGANLIFEAVLAAVFVLLANTLLRPVVNAMNRRPLDDVSTEATYQVFVVASHALQAEAREALSDVLEKAQLPVRELEIEPFGADEIEICATLLPTSLDTAELERRVAELATRPEVSQAYWNSTTQD